MAAKIKDRNPYSDNHHGKPRGVSKHAFERVYWPYIPVIIAIGLLLPLGFKSHAFSHPTGKVLSYSLSSNPNALLIDTNVQRKAAGAPLLQLNNQLSAAATAKAQDMAKRDYWSHSTPEGTPPWAFVSATGYSYQKLGENLATGFANENQVISAWMASPPHRENLLDPSYRQVGFGFANCPNYLAVGGGPMTIVVAYYGDPSSSIPLSQIKPASSQTPSSDNLLTAPSLSVGTGQLAIGSTATVWAPVVLITIACAILGLFAGRHLRAIRRVVKDGEQYIWSHPLFDLGLAIVVLLLILLARTVGYIQ